MTIPVQQGSPNGETQPDHEDEVHDAMENGDATQTHPDDEVEVMHQEPRQESANGNHNHHNNSSNVIMDDKALAEAVGRESTTSNSRFGGLAGAVEASVQDSIERNLGASMQMPFPVTPVELGNLSNDRTRAALADLLEASIRKGAGSVAGVAAGGGMKMNMKFQHSTTSEEFKKMESSNAADAEPLTRLQKDCLALIHKLRAAGEAPQETAGHNNNGNHEQALAAIKEADQLADMAANVLTSVVLRSSPESGIDPREVEFRKEQFGSNAITEKALEPFWKLCYEAVQDFVLMMLIVLGVISIVVESTSLNPDGNCSTCWIEGAAILCSVCIVVLVTAGIDYAKQFAFIRLTRSLHETNTKQVIRDGQQVSIIDDDIVVGDILSVNAHNLASIPADCVLLGPPADLKMDESTLTGESKLVPKMPGDVVLSGTHAAQGSGKMLVIAVGVNSVAGRIKARVYESDDAEADLQGDDENSPLFVKLDLVAQRIGIGGTIAASISFIVSCIIGLAIKGENAEHIVDYLVTAITVLAVAVPEGLPLAVTLALAFSSNKMMREQNLVKHLDACETMGCATTICTDKTGTLTANRMTARALYAGMTNYLVDDPSMSLGDFCRHAIDPSISPAMIDLISRAIAIDTMNETVLYKENKQDKNAITSSTGNPTEVALLHLVHDLGCDYQLIRNTTKGRSDQGALGEFLAMGKQYGFSSARKMMSWAVPLDNGGYRLYSKGAQEVILGRCASFVAMTGEDLALSQDERNEFQQIAVAYARRGMRCLAMAYRDLPPGFDMEAKSDTVKNSDGAPAFAAETDMSIICLVGIEDPLRPEVPGAIEKCYRAGIDVRMVTGDSPNTAVSIAYQAGILRDFHFREGTTERVAANLKENVLMEGKDFRAAVFVDAKVSERSLGPASTAPGKEFDQASFDKIWPHLRVLARSSPDDKLTLAHGLNQSNLFADREYCARLERDEGIKIFPDRQVVAMTGDGTNDAPALKRADIGFAMGIAGTQIAKDAADIILLDDNFASIVTAAKWGRNVYASIQKFLQFQLTVNIAAVVTALVGSFAYQTSPLAAIQLLWVNLLMDSLASLALASEPPVEELLNKDPVNRTDSMITKHMWANMLGHAAYQIAVVMTLLFEGPEWFDIPHGHKEEEDGRNSIHFTLIFNSFVWMQLFNEMNSRKLKGEVNVFAGLLNNPLFCAILVSTSILQVLIVEFGSIAFHVHEDGLSLKYWLISLGFGAGSLPVQQIINVLFRLGQHWKGCRSKKRHDKAHRQITHTPRH